MSERALIVLGTSSQVPTRYRNHNGYFLRWDGEGFLFDPGEGTQRQMIFAEVPPPAITRICITHFHGDHCLGLAGICQRLSLDRVPHSVHVYYPASGQPYFDRLRAASIFHDVATIVPHPIDTRGSCGIIDRGRDWTLTALPLDHGVDTVGYRLDEQSGRRMVPDRLAELGIRGKQIRELIETGEFLVGDRLVHIDEVSEPRPGQSVAFVMDTRICANAVELARGVDMLICESTFLAMDEDKADTFGHLSARQAATIARDAGVRRLVLCHFSQRYPDERLFVEEARPIHGDVVAARDCDHMAVPKRRER